MSLSRTILAAPLLALGFAAPLALSGCGGSRDKPQSSQMSKQVDELQADVEELRHQISATSSALNLMVATRSGSDLKQDYKQFVDASGHVDSRYQRVLSHTADLRSKREQYLDDWNRNIQSISDPKTKQTQQERLNDVEKRFDDVAKEVDSLKSDIDDYRRGLSDLRTAFQYDLTANGVKAMSDPIDSSQDKASDIQDKLGTVSGTLAQWANAMRPTA
jgi:predicted  nucleic acid-binding Zn-ribbon protein